MSVIYYVIFFSTLTTNQKKYTRPINWNLFYIQKLVNANAPNNSFLTAGASLTKAEMILVFLRHLDFILHIC